MVFILFILLNLYAATSGLRDAGYFSGLAGAAFKFDPHRIFVIERVFVVLAILAATQVTILASGWVLAAWALSFSLAHNSSYLAGRDIIAHRPIDVTRSSPTSTALLEFGFKKKVAMAVVGIALLVVKIIWCAN